MGIGDGMMVSIKYRKYNIYSSRETHLGIVGSKVARHENNFE